MTYHHSPRLIAIVCMVVAVSLLLLAWRLAPPTRPMVPPTPIPLIRRTA